MYIINASFHVYCISMKYNYNTKWGYEECTLFYPPSRVLAVKPRLPRVRRPLEQWGVGNAGVVAVVLQLQSKVVAPKLAQYLPTTTLDPLLSVKVR